MPVTFGSSNRVALQPRVCVWIPRVAAFLISSIPILLSVSRGNTMRSTPSPQPLSLLHGTTPLLEARDTAAMAAGSTVQRLTWLLQGEGHPVMEARRTALMQAASAEGFGRWGILRGPPAAAEPWAQCCDAR